MRKEDSMAACQGAQMLMLGAGLDARAANIVMRVMRNIANGRAIVCTIHQPSIAVFEVCPSI